MIRTILVALDGSHFAEHALAHASRLTRQTGAALVLVRVAPPFTMVSENLASPGSGTVREAEVYLNAVADRLLREGLTVHVAALHGLAPEAIVSTAQALDADLIAMGTHGRSGLRQVILGSVAHEVLRQTTLPVLLVRASEPPVEVGTGPYHTILVPLDGTAFAEAALSYLAQEELDREATLVLLRAVSPTEAHGAEDQQPAAALAYLDSLVKTHVPGRTFQTLVRVDDPAKAILETAALERVDLIVMATRGRAGLDRLIYGSVARHLLHHAPVPLLLVHQPADVAAISEVSATNAIEVPQETPPTIAMTGHQTANQPR